MNNFGTTGTRSQRVPAFIERPLAAVRHWFARPRAIEEDVRVGVQVADDSVTVAVYSQLNQALTLCVKRRCTRAQVPDVIAQLVAEHDLKGLPAYLTLSRTDYETQYVDLPGVPADELRAALRWRVTPPGVLNAEDIAVAGLPLVSDRSDSGEESPLIRAAVMAESALSKLSQAVIGAGLNLRAVAPRETALMNVAYALDQVEADQANPSEQRPPVMTIFLGSRTCGILVTRGHRLYLSRTVELAANEAGALELADFEKLVTEVIRTAENFNKRLSRVPLGRCLIVPYRSDAQAFDERLRDTLGIDCETVALADWLNVSGDSAAADTATGILAVGGIIEPTLQRETSLYTPPTPPRRATAPAVLAGWVAGGWALLAMIAITQAVLIDRAEERLTQQTAVRDALQSDVAELSAKTEDTEDIEPSESLVAELNSLEQQRDFYATILEEFQGVDTSLNRGFSDALTALARTPVDGLWLQQIAITPEQVKLEGQTLKGFQAETLIDTLQSEEIFRTWNPESIDVGSPEPIRNGRRARSFSIEGEGLDARIQGPRNIDDSTTTRETDALGIQSLLRTLRRNE